MSFAIGKLVVIKLISPQKESWGKCIQLAVVRAMFYTPTVGMGGHGIALLPTVVAMIFTESKYYLTMLSLPIIVLTISLFTSLVVLSGKKPASSDKKYDK